ncbi:hypothetical protein H2199_001112 [Coniosporium tulheliwenetii]|uniref:Uncharacterized protein n=1 Tax=Coniosporium tulheliwenetii TaxID=3383036 RepID=A0ACC2ZL34_9PEZI|nr:hypothetical protein H2199_001112 [Cladosporium sp. JES 115]
MDRIKPIKGRKPVGLPSSANPAQPQQPMFGGFGGFTGFGQQQDQQQQPVQQSAQQNGSFFGNTQSSQSFPPTNGAPSFGQNGASVSFGGFGNAAVAGGAPQFNPAPPSGGFNFSSVGSNPFSNPSNGATNASTTTNGGASSGFSGSIFNIPPAQPTNEAPKSNLFNFAASAPPTNSFNTPGPSANATQPSSNPFGFPQPATSAQAVPNLFGTPRAEPQAAPGFFSFLNKGNNAGTPQQATPAVNTALSPEEMQVSPDNSPAKANGQQDDQRPSPFASLNAPPTQPNGTQTSNTSLFSRTTPADTTSQASAPPAQEPPQTAPKANPFAALKRSATGASGAPSNLFQPKPAAATSQAGTNGVPASTADASSSATGSLFGNAKSSILSSTPSTTSNMFGNLKPSATTAASSPASNMFGSLKPPSTSSAPAAQPNIPAPDISPSTGGLPEPPAHFTDAQKQQFQVGWRMCSLNVGLREYLATLDPISDWSQICRFYLAESAKFMAVLSKKRKADEPAAAEGVDGNGTVKRSRAEDQVSYPKLPEAQPAQETSQTSSIFKNIFDKASQPVAEKPAPPAETSKPQPAAAPSFQAASPASTVFGAATSASATTSSNPFGGFSTTLGNTSSAPTNLFSTKPATTAPVANKPSEAPAASPFQFKPSTAAASNANAPAAANPFQFKPSSTTSTNSISAPAAASPFQFKPTTAASANNAGTGTVPGSVPFGGVASPFKIAGAPQTQPGVSTSSGLQLPKFGDGVGTTNFLAAFGKQVEKTQQAETKKRKEEDFDSDEETEEQWRKKDEEKQRAKRAKLEEAAKSIVSPTFNIGQSSFTVGASQQKQDKASSAAPSSSSQPQTSASPTNGLFMSGTVSPTPSTGSVFGTHRLGANNSLQPGNMFAHLSDVESGAEAGQDDAGESESATGEDEEAADEQQTGQTSANGGDDEASDEETIEDSMRKSRSPAKNATTPGTSTPGAGRSMFDRIKMGADGMPEREEPSNQDSDPDKTPKANPFGFPTTSTSTLFGNSTLFGKSASPAGDNTWKNDSPIKFAGAKPNAAPAFNFTPASPGKPSTGDESNKENSAASNPLPVSSPALGFAFGAPPTSGGLSPMPGSSVFGGSGFTSRATTPGISENETSAAESTAEGDAESNEPQRDLTSLSEQERREETVIFECAKSKATKYNPKAETDKAKWSTLGVGPLRILKHNTTGVTRVLMKAAPRGNVIINSRLLSQMEYKKVQQKMVQVPLPDETGKITSFFIRFGQDSDADAFAKACEENKAH